MNEKRRTWSYHGENGQNTWKRHYPAAEGKYQSPVNINSRETIYDTSLTVNPLEVNYSLSRDTDLLNTGHTIALIPRGKSSVSGGPLPLNQVFELIDVRFRWGINNHVGSEHTVNGKALPMELQLNHWNSSLYRTPQEAQGKPNGVAIIAIFIQIGREHSSLRTIIDNLEDIQYKGREKALLCSFNPNSLLPDPMLRDYWTYEGSLTCPPCHENVMWIVFRYPLTVAHSQMDEFRRLRTHAKGVAPSNEEAAMSNNFRFTQPLNGRIVRASFPQ